MKKLILFAALAFVTGCSNTQDQMRECIQEARILLKHPAVGGPRWESSREKFLVDSTPFADVSNEAPDAPKGGN